MAEGKAAMWKGGEHVVLYSHRCHHVYTLAHMCILTTISGIRMNVS